MKKLKKIMALVIAMAMVVAMAMPAMAAANEYTITVTNTNENVTIAGKTYYAHKLFDLKYSGDNYAYTISTSNTFYTTAKTVLDTYFDFADIASDPNTKTVTVKESKKNADGTLSAADVRALADALQQYIPATSSLSATVAAGAETCTIDVGEAGYFIITGNADPKDPKQTEEVVSAVMLDNTDKTATVNPKVEIPKLDKKITGEHVLDAAGKAATAEVGKTVSYELDSNVPDLTGFSAYTFVISDTMTSGLTFTDPEGAATNDVVVKINDVDKTSDVTVEISGQTLTVTVPYDVLKAATKNDPIVVTYSAVVNSNALNTNYEKNTANLEYSHSPYDTSTNKTPDKEVYVIDVNIDVNKYTGEITEAQYISSAEYNELDEEAKAEYTAVADAEAGKEYMKAGSAGTPLENAKFKLFKGTAKPADDALAWYKYNTTTNKVEWVAKANADEFVTGSNGHFSPNQVRGLEAEKTGTAYGLLETEAPTGYNLLKDPVLFTLTGAYDDTNKQATISASAGSVEGGTIDVSATAAAQPVVTEPVLNQSGAELPSTGGIGTTMFYIIGAILVLGAGILLVTRRRMSVQ